MHLSVGARVRSFEVLGPLGAGGMGTVYRARDSKLGRDVAIKILQDDLSHNREYLHRFQREARAASALNHPNIVTIFEINEHDGAPFIAMELIEGTSLRELLKKGPLPVRKLLDVATQITDGLAAAHERGIVHRDLKPENVMVTNDGRVKILDFGLAHVNRSSSPDESTSEFSSVRTPEGRVLGTASYVSPEQAGGSRSIDYRSDQFSFGSLLYELATGRRAFQGNSAVETLAAIMRDEPEPVQRRNPKVPPQLCWIIERCLSKDPSDRYSSTRDLARELRTLRDRLPETSPGRVPLPLRWSLRTRAIVIAALVIAAAVAIITSAHRVRSPDQRLPNQKYLAVLPFNDRSGRADGQLFSQGFGEAVSARLSKYSGIQVIPPASSSALIAKKSSFQRIAQELGATLLLNASVQRAGDALRVSYTIVDPARGADVAGDAVNGTVQNVWAVQDEVADAVARDLGIGQRRLPTEHAGLESAEEQDLYVRALGALDHPDDEKSIESAIDLLHQLTETESDSSLVQGALGRAYEAKYVLAHDPKDAEHALRACRRASDLEPNGPDVLVTLANVQRLTGQYDQAIATYRRALTLQPNSPEASIGLGRAYQGTKQYDQAEQSFRRGISLRPTWWYGYNYLGALDLTRGRYDEAAKQFAEVIRLNPQSPWGYVNAGGVALAKGNLQGAIAPLTRAIALREDADAYSNLGYSYYFLGQYDKAAASNRRATELRPSVATYWANLADSCRWSQSCPGEADRDYRKAIELLRQDLAVNPRNARAHATMAVCLAATGSRSEADQHIRQALDLDPENPTRMYQAARVANARRDTAAAVSWLKRALSAGYQQFEIERDPEFSDLRGSEAFRALFNKTPQTT